MTYSWEIEKVDFAIEKNGLDNVAIYIHFKYYATHDSGETDFIGGVYELNDPDGNNFTNYLSLTKDNFINWLSNGMDTSAMQHELNKRITEKINPTIITINYN